MLQVITRQGAVYRPELDRPVSIAADRPPVDIKPRPDRSPWVGFAPSYMQCGRPAQSKAAQS